MVTQTEAQTILTYALDIGEGLLTRGAEVGRVEDTVQRILRAKGALRVDVFSITTSILVTAHWDFGPITQTRRVSQINYDMAALTRLNDLSREICRKELSPETVSEKLRIITTAPGYSQKTLVLLYGLASFTFSIFFGGSLLDALLSGLLGMLLRLIRRGMELLQVPNLAVTLVCSVLGGFLAHGLMWAGIPCAADKISIGNIMLLVPGIGITNAIRDMFTGDTISGLLRFTEALLLSLALALGFALPSLLMG